MTMLPFQLTPRSEARVWGGDKIAKRFDRPVPAGDKGPIGESWEVYGDLLVREGPYRGQTLDQLTTLLGQGLLGSKGGDPAEGFPLLIKWLDCRDWLSVQVHPDDVTARRLTGKATARGKSECWFFLDVEPGAEIIHDLQATPEQIARADGKSWLDLVERKSPHAGDWIYIPAGTVHALGPGLMLFEVQQSSDITYRLYDWDRMGLDGHPRPLHLQESRQVLASPSLKTPPPSPGPGDIQDCLGKVVVSTPFFVIEEISGEREWKPGGESFEIVTIMEGTARLSSPENTLNLVAGDSVIVPAQAPILRMEADGPRPWTRVRKA